MELNPVDEFVQTRVLLELRPVVELIREMMRKSAPQAKEILSYGIPAYRVRRIIAVISPTQKDITFAFSRGAEIKDTYGLLRGTGKVSRHVKIKSVDSVNMDALREYIRQALELEAGG